ncbi:hypothetical protein TNCV_1845021 [Trichonephila clavipes]|nr:hypothetical protein TNCV_1845021 [Trichonephila clavipes]
MNDLSRGSPPAFQRFLEKSAYVIDRDVVDLFSNFQKHPYQGYSIFFPAGSVDISRYFCDMVDISRWQQHEDLCKKHYKTKTIFDSKMWKTD